MTLRHWFARAAALFFALAATAAGANDVFPNKPIRLVVPFAPGGTTDVLARAVAVHMGQSLGQTIIVDNKPGAGGNIGADNVAKATPDGYTLLLGTPGPLAINPSLFPNLTYKPEKDFAAVGQMITIQTVVIVLPGSPYKTLRDMLAAAKVQGKLNYASAGNGTTPHLAAELLAAMAGVNLAHVPYKGDAPALTDLLGGHVPVMFANIAGVAGQLRDGKVRALAVTGPTRTKLLPDVPTVAEAGVPGYAVTAWAGIAAPAGTSALILARLNAELNSALAAPDVIERMQQLSADVVRGTPEQMATLMRSEQARWAKLIAEKKITLE